MENSMPQDNTNTPSFTHDLPTYKKITDVQQTWREFGWAPPSENAGVQQKWHFYRTLTTDKR
jgi:hypothetical protein